MAVRMRPGGLRQRAAIAELVGHVAVILASIPPPFLEVGKHTGPFQTPPMGAMSDDTATPSVMLN